MSSLRHERVLMIGLDAAEITLVERWIAEGLLPNLATLAQRGAFGPLLSTADWLVGSPWPTFYSGTSPEDHGLYHYLVWRPDRMTSERPSPEWLQLEPFWRRLGAAGRRAIAIDVPLTYPPQSFDGIELSGWATHEILLRAGAHPQELMPWVRKTFGSPPFRTEPTHPLRAGELLQEREHWLETIRVVADLGTTLARQEPWDLLLICFAATHRCGHQLWDLTSMSGRATPDQLDQLQEALKDIYVACDQAVGRLLEVAGADATVLVFALHGMGPNQSRAELLPEMLKRLLSAAGGGGEVSSHVRAAERVRRAVPLRWRNWVKRHLPFSLQDSLTLFWRSGGIDWSTTPAFAMFCDLEGYIRINLKGREASGIVEPGQAYEELCERITEGLLGFVDEDTGEPLVESVGRGETLFGDGRMRALLPDLIVRWSPTSAARHRRIVSERFGVIAWPTPGHHPQGRSGNHRGRGFLFAAGAGVSPGSAIEGAHILDLAPSVHQLLGLAVPQEMRGRPLF